MPSKTLRKGAVTYQVAERTDQGLVRRNNEDCVISSRENGLYGVCDGMGGHAAGEVASSLACKALLEEVNCDSGDPGESLRQGIELANKRIFEIQTRKPEYKGMGTTVSALWISPSESSACWIVHIGDSRIYQRDSSGFRQLTEDHSPVFRLYREGMISKDQMRSHPHKNLLERSLGVLPEVEPDVFEIPSGTGDLILVCSDGLTDELTDREIEEIVSQGEVEDIADRLVAQAKATGGRDNISLIVLKVLKSG